jgi:para-nitrobenzyl esterase
MKWLCWLIAILALGCDDGADVDPMPMNDAAMNDAAVGDAALDATADAYLGDGFINDMAGDMAVEADTGVVSACAPVDVAAEAGLVATSEGPVQGTRDAETWTWKGIPFAAPPVGDLRWRPAEAPACRDAVLAADAFGSVCPQITLDGAQIGARGDEDCLTLNVWSPVDAADATPRAVMVFIHGGGNIIGSASDGNNGLVTYRGAHLADRSDVVVVTVQYRLGALGFLSLPALDAESGTSGNLGLRDQVTALRWVQANIDAFGGDPERVMIFGESAGAINTCALLATPAAAGLFHRAGMQSAGCNNITQVAAQAVGVQAAALLECAADDLVCLRAVDADTIVRTASGTVGIGESPAANGLGWGPTGDTETLPQTPLAALREGALHPVPLLIGSNADEMASPGINRVQVGSVMAYESLVRASFAADDADRILEAYPAEAFETPNDAFIQLATDSSFTRRAREVARAHAETAPVYRYFFQRRAETRQGRLPAQHGIELIYVFGTYADIRGFQAAAGETAVAEDMMDAWTRFAKTGDPSGAGGEAWPAYALPEETSRVFDDPPVGTEDGVRGDLTDLWDDILGPR